MHGIEPNTFSLGQRVNSHLVSFINGLKAQIA